MLLNIQDVNKIYNGETILEHIDLSIDEKDRIGLIGVNGCGKSTLIKLITKEILPDHLVETDGQVGYSRKISIGYLAQMDGLEGNSTVLEAMREVFSDVLETAEKMKKLENEGKADSEEYADLFTWFEANDGYNIDVKIKTVLNGMGFGEELFNRVVSSFSGGEKTRLAIAKLLLEQPNLLILDEPTNHLDFNTVLWLEDYLNSYNGAILVVSHDRYFLDKVCTSICEIENKHLTRYKGNYSKFHILKEEKTARLQKEYEIQQKKIDKMEDYVAKNLVRASTSKSAKSRIKALNAMDVIENPTVTHKDAVLNFTYAIEPPEEVLNVRSVDLTVGSGSEKKTLLDNISFTVRRGEKLGIVGDNGIGKSTLLKVLQNIIHHNGIVRWNQNVKYSYFEQESESLDKLLTVFDTIKERYPLMTDFEVRSLLGKVRISGENVFKEIGVISGGERAKVCFALIMLEHSNVLILDEPTNHLDIYTREVLEDALSRYTGTIIFVSHDRYLLNRISTNVLELTANGAEMFNGNFDNYMNIKERREQEERAAEEFEKAQKAREAAKQKKENVYKSKAQRAEEAKIRARIKELEKSIDDIQNQIDTLSEEITKPEIASDFKLMNEKCLLIEELKNKMDEQFEELCELS
ncbi:MAG: ABC-F family ATP-binding cassette domain-containing protein [Oscillospiraceae bacterium]|nr:ABC-F family ATP-binding cassette domain-containing protein [Oscillospiraceae bacterium]MDY3258517.1 ABC-F family ATP-binding cassette domain-containing protein [Ruminococcus callidus]